MFLRSLFLDHYWMKLFALVLAGLVWLAIRFNPTFGAPSALRLDSATRTTNLLHQTVRVLNEVGAVPAITLEPAKVNVTLRGPEADLNALGPGDIQVFVRTHVADEDGLANVQVWCPPELTVLRVTPPAVHIKPAPGPAVPR